MTRSTCSTYLVFNRDPALHLDGTESGAGELVLEVADALSKAGNQVIACARFTGDFSSNSYEFECWDLGANYNVVSALDRAKGFDTFHLISIGSAFPLIASQNLPRCVSRILVSIDSSPSTSGVSAETLTQIADKVICIRKTDAVLMATSGLSSDMITLVTIDAETDESKHKQWERMAKVLGMLATEVATPRFKELPERADSFVIGESMPDSSQDEHQSEEEQDLAGEQDKVDRSINDALLLLKDQRVSEALEVLTIADGFSTPVRDLYYVKALCFMKLGKLDETRDALKEELRHFPGNTPAEELLIEVLQTR